jgi:lactose/L-arabinose transport system ATP-binding protein
MSLKGELPTTGGSVVLGVRPEHFGRAGEGDCDITVTVDVAEHLGSTSFAYANTKGEELVIERDPALHELGSDMLTVSISAARAYVFDASGKRLR